MNGNDLHAEVLRCYGDIIDRPHHRSANRPHMSLVDRAAQFSPFAALTGHGAAIQETARLTEQDIDLTEDARTMLDRRLEQLLHMEVQPMLSVTFFQPDEKKDGGAYVAHRGVLKRIDAYRRTLLLTDGTVIPIDRIVGIESEAFSASDR